MALKSRNINHLKHQIHWGTRLWGVYLFRQRKTMRMAIQYLKDAVSPFAFLLLEANGGGGQCDLILYGDQADTEFLQAIYVRIGVQEIAAQPGHARYDHGTHPPV